MMVPDTRRPPSTETDVSEQSELTDEQRTSAATEAARLVARTLTAQYRTRRTNR